MLLLIFKDGGRFDAPPEPPGAAVGQIVATGRTMKFVQSMLIGLLFTLLISCRGVSDFSVFLAPDAILHNGKIVTVNKDFSVVQAVAIKNGRFVAVGSDREILPLAGAKTQKIDLAGKTVLPGFNDSHIHVATGPLEAPDPSGQKLRGANSVGEILEIVRQKVEATPPGRLVRFLQGPSRMDQIKEKRWPTRQDFDSVSPKNPILISRVGPGTDDYVWITNSLGLAAAKINRNTPQPDKRGVLGKFEMAPRTGEPTGVLAGPAAQQILREALKVDSAEEMETRIARAVEFDITPYGITSFSDPLQVDNIQPQRAYQRLASRKQELPVRVNLMIRIPLTALSTEESLSLMDRLPFAPPFKNNFLRVGTFKIALDKARPGDRPYIVSAEKGKLFLIEGHRRGWQLYVHITTPEAFDYACEALEEAYRLYPRQDARHVFTHIPFPTRENLATMKRLGIIADLQVASVYHVEDNAQENLKINPKRPDLGPKPVATYWNAGIPVILSSDQTPVGPLFAIWEAVNRLRKSGKVFQPEERLTLQEAIRGTTIRSAWTFFEDDVKGSIEAGKYADLVVLGRDILTVNPTEIKDIPVLMTMTNGKLVYVNPKKDPRQQVDYFRYPSRISYLQ